ncbi:MAG: hypothetical protein U5N86_03990 [Planctomycetota bacterium]|nr:hypothetical protein [Planctomycetota bacterium]
MSACGSYSLGGTATVVFEELRTRDATFAGTLEISERIALNGELFVGDIGELLYKLRLMPLDANASGEATYTGSAELVFSNRGMEVRGSGRLSLSGVYFEAIEYAFGAYGVSLDGEVSFEWNPAVTSIALKGLSGTLDGLGSPYGAMNLHERATTVSAEIELGRDTEVSCSMDVSELFSLSGTYGNTKKGTTARAEVAAANAARFFEALKMPEYEEYLSYVRFGSEPLTAQVSFGHEKRAELVAEANASLTVNAEGVEQELNGIRLGATLDVEDMSGSFEVDVRDAKGLGEVLATGKLSLGDEVSVRSETGCILSQRWR